ncbi:hypothetical protein Taro_028739 [Colocasia esculenta]|uniref:Uncharacterized protein n=1 Tax=Colocasia esculenta TaxID=4460 RepID=A0A843VI17_COLES|nr:hypothetical protein [Colocasia esculenta]
MVDQAGPSGLDHSSPDLVRKRPNPAHLEVAVLPTSSGSTENAREGGGTRTPVSSPSSARCRHRRLVLRFSSARRLGLTCCHCVHRWCPCLVSARALFYTTRPRSSAFYATAGASISEEGCKTCDSWFFFWLLFDGEPPRREGCDALHVLLPPIPSSPPLCPSSPLPPLSPSSPLRILHSNLTFTSSIVSSFRRRPPALRPAAPSAAFLFTAARSALRPVRRGRASSIARALRPSYRAVSAVPPCCCHYRAPARQHPAFPTREQPQPLRQRTCIAVEAGCPCTNTRTTSTYSIMADQVKGSVSPLASMFPAEEVQKAVKRVEEAISEQQKELEHLHLFASDNANLINLVQRLPDELSHDIMVPFGKAAFFPGRLIHTNEFLVLLGEGYFAERSAKQTVDILQRRGKALEYQVESLKAVISDLKAEAKFFDTTAVEAKEGLVEIREDYVEEPEAESGNHHMEGSASPGTSAPSNVHITDEEYARIESRLAELEMEELECASSDDNDDKVEASSSFLPPNDQQIRESLLNVSEPISKGKEVLSGTSPQLVVPKQIANTHSPSEDFKQDYDRKDDFLLSTSSEYSGKHSQVVESPKGLVHEATLPKVEKYTDSATGRTSRMESDQPKAFTGSVVERTDGLLPSMSTRSIRFESFKAGLPVQDAERQPLSVVCTNAVLSTLRTTLCHIVVAKALGL